jgi:peptidoglycan-associated lipoprotein
MSFFTLNSLKTGVALAAIAALSACASQKPPAPAPVESTPPPHESYTPPPPPPTSRPMAPVGPVPGSTQDFVISAGDRVYFDYDQYSVRDDGRGVLDRQAQWLGRYPQVQVRIEGNCDERGTREYNFALGARRADAIKSYLVSHGVQPGRITTISYGKERPLDDGTGEDAYAKNRNGHTALTAGAAGGGY